ncbi:MAG TPA: alkaline phosphatase family protein, partial [Gemmatimonadales bacterium]|nr:alkaline phosphatase family protein [Gemmatimonadales bacterium]
MRRAAALVSGAVAAAGIAGAQAAPARPTLVVLIAVDQMRGDYLGRWGTQWNGGFARFWNRGTVYERGRQDHASTETAPGHSTMLSGREPASTGIVLNSRGVPDPLSPVLGMTDPVGASPRRFQGSTLYDWMLARDPGARVLSVSRKDRGAILPVGRARGDVYWYAGGQFTTSRYYADTLPTWVRVFNARGGVARLAGTTWNLLRPAADYAEPDSEPFENAWADVTFPHQLPDQALIATRVTAYPWMDSLTLALALDGVGTLGLGRRASPDLLVVSLSTTDAVGHAFGPDSREIHDQLLRVDLWLGQFFDSLAKLVPAGMVVALTGDHGVSALPEYTVLVRHQPGGRVWLGGLGAALQTALGARYHADFGLTFENGLLSADVDALRARGIDMDSLAAALARQAGAVNGVGRVFTPAALAAASASDAAAGLWKRLLPPGYGWLLCATTKPGYVWSGGGTSAEHGAGDSDDVSVPVAFWGAGIPAQRLDRA